MSEPISANILNRFSIRSFDGRPIPQDDLSAILKAGIIAPSSKNRQPWQITVISGDRKSEIVSVMRRAIEDKKKNSDDDDYRSDLSSALKTMDIMDQAPVLLAVGYKERNPYRNARGLEGGFTDRMLVDTLSIGACIENMILEATERGIGSLWVGDHLYAEKELKEALGVDYNIVSMVVLGYSNRDHPASHKRADDRIGFI